MIEKKKKKIMLVSPMLHQGGLERICVMTARILQKEYDVVIVVFSLKDVAYDIEGLQVIDLNIPAKNGKINKAINVIKRGIKLTRLQKKLSIDVSYSFGMTANIANALTYGAEKKITACHSFEEIKNSVYMRLISACSDKVICCSKKMKDMVEKKYKFSNVEALWNPCDVEAIRNQSNKVEGEDLSFFSSEDTVLVSMGREDNVKGFWHLIKVFKRVNEQDSKTKLAIIGSGLFTEYKMLVKELGLEDKVWFAGLKKNPFPYLKAGDLYVLTSISEGLPNALVESLALSLPIVSVNCLSGPAEILHNEWQVAENKKGIFEADFGVLTPPMSPRKNLLAEYEEDGKRIKLEPEQEMFAEAVLKMIRDKMQNAFYVERAGKRAEDFACDNYLKGLVSYMETI